MSMNNRCFFILDRIVWPLTTFTDRPENSFRSSAFQRLFFRSSSFKICQPMQKLCTASCLTVWAFLLKMNGLTKKAECSSSSRLRMSRGLYVAQTTKRPGCSGNLKNLVWLNENVEGKESHVWCMWKTFRQNLQRRVSRIVIMTILVALGFFPHGRTLGYLFCYKSVWNKRAACIGTMQNKWGLGIAQQAFLQSKIAFV